MNISDVWPCDLNIFDPCCGSRPGVIRYTDQAGATKWRVMCSSCGEREESADPADVMIAWNRRKRGVPAGKRRP